MYAKPFFIKQPTHLRNEQNELRELNSMQVCSSINEDNNNCMQYCRCGFTLDSCAKISLLLYSIYFTINANIPFTLWIIILPISQISAACIKTTRSHCTPVPLSNQTIFHFILPTFQSLLLIFLPTIMLSLALVRKSRKTYNRFSGQT